MSVTEPLLKCRAAPSGKGAGDAPLSIGVKTGVFRRCGIDVDMVPVSGGTGRIAQALTSSEIDFAVMPGIPLVEANMNGSQLVMLLSLVSINLHAIIGGKDVTEPAQLKGRVLGGQGGGGLDDLLLRQALAEWRLDADCDVTIRNVGDRPHLWAALERGEIAAFAVTAPLTIQAELFGYPLLRRFWEPADPFQLGAICTRRSLIEQTPEAVRRFMRGLVESIRLFQADRRLGIEHIRQMTEVSEPTVLERTYDLFAEQMRRPYPNPAAIKAVIETVARVDNRANDLRPDELIDASFLDELRSQGAPLPS